MPKVVQLKDGTRLLLEDKAFANGGEADLFKIIDPSSFQKQVVKIYKPNKRTKEREEKINYLAVHPPTLQVRDGHHSVIWVNQCVYEKGIFIGFTMPIAKGEKLELLCYVKTPKNLSDDWKKFNFNDPKAVELRLKLCFNIAVAINQIHDLGKYVLVDMKPENIMIQPNGLISIIDMDSVAVVENNKVIFPASVITPEYTPAEYYKGLKLNSSGLNVTWDRFSLSVIFYRLLCGIHPFTGSCTTPYDKCNGLADMVENGLFPHGQRSSNFIVIPPPHNNFYKLPPEIQELFKRCFDKGHTNPEERPSADEWCRNLSPQQIITIKRSLPSASLFFPLHNFSNGINYSPVIDVSFPVVKYLDLFPLKGFKFIIAGIVGKSKQQKLEDLIRICEHELKSSYTKKQVYELELKEIVENFRIHQAAILKERSQIDQLKSYFTSVISDIDKAARDMHFQEAQEMKVASDTIKIAFTKIDQEVKQLHSDILGRRFAHHEIQKSELVKNVNDLQVQEKIDIDNLVQSSTKLLKYKISEKRIEIFSSNLTQIVRSLSRVGINTAADFTDINSEGQIKNRSGQWLKVTGVGLNRANLLDDWRRKCEVREDQVITITIKQNYQSRFSALQQSLNSIDAIFQQEIQPFQIKFSKEKDLFDKLKAKHNKLYQEKISNIKEMYDKRHLPLIVQAKEFLNLMFPKINEISNEIQNELNDNLQKHTSLLSIKQTRVRDFIAQLDIEINKLSTLHKELNQVS